MASDPAQLLKAARTAADLSQAELAARAGTSQSAVAAYEGGARRPTIAVLERLLTAAGHRLQMSTHPTAHRPTLEAVRDHGDAIRAIARTYRAVPNSVRIFGSVARGDARPESDIDLLVEFESGATLLQVIGMESDLTEALGHPVHVTTTGAARGRLATITAEAVPL